MPVPETYRVYSRLHELRGLESDLGSYHDFVIKPSQGRGRGIIVIADRQERDWVGVSGKVYSIHDIKKHISDIMFGVYSLTLQ